MVVLTVERERLVVECQLDSSHTDVVPRRTEAYSQRVVAQATAHTTDKIHQGGVGKVVLYGAVEVEHTLCGIASACNHGVAAELGLHKMLANRHGKLIVAAGVTLYHLAVGVLQRTIHIHLNSFDGHVGTCIIDVAAHHERRHVLEVGFVVDERVVANKKNGLAGIELVDTIHGHDGVGRSFTRERYALDDVVAVLVGLGLQLEGVRRKCRGLGVAAHATMVLVIVGAIARIIEELCAQTLVEGPVGLKAVLVAHQQMVVVLQ